MEFADEMNTDLKFDVGVGAPHPLSDWANPATYTPPSLD